MMLTLMVTSKGVAAVPRASLVILAGTLASFGLPLEAVAVILGVDELMDMARTTVNLIGNCLATCVMARWEGEFDDNATGVLPGEEAASSSVGGRISAGRNLRRRKRLTGRVLDDPRCTIPSLADRVQVAVHRALEWRQ